MLRAAIDQKNWYKVMDLYAEWAPNNKEKCCTGFAKTVMPVEEFTSPWGIINFMREHNISEEDAVEARLRVSTILSKTPELAEKNTKIFSKTFKKLIQNKKNRLKKRDNKKQRAQEKALENFFTNKIDETVPVNEPIFPEQSLQNTGDILVALAKAGAKNVKTPDGWEVQF